MPSQLARFTDRIVDLSQKAVVGDPDPAVEKGDGGYADWVIVAVHCLREYYELVKYIRGDSIGKGAKNKPIDCYLHNNYEDIDELY